MFFSLFTILNFFCSIGVSIWFINTYFTKKYLFVKPSIILLMYTHIFFQWPMVFLSDYYEKMLVNPYVVPFLINGYILIGILISPLILQEKAKTIWSHLTSHPKETTFEFSNFSLYLLTIVATLISLFYFSYVPFTKTGLYTLFADPLNAAVARENSLKLLNSQLIKYLYSITRTSLVPLLSSFIFLRLLTRWNSFHFNSMITYFEIIVLTFSAIFVSLTGERASLAYLMLLGGIINLWKSRLKLQSIKVLSFFILCFIPPLFISMARYRSFSFFWHYATLIFERIFITPFKVGVWYIKYEQDIGPFGIAGFEKISKVFGIIPINAPNIVGLKFAPEYYDAPDMFLQSISAGAGYLFSYYGYLGIFSFPLSLLALLFLDVALMVYIRLKTSLLIPCLSCITLACLAFIQSDYTVGLVTHGFAGILLLSWIFSLGENYLANNPFNFWYKYAKKK